MRAWSALWPCALAFAVVSPAQSDEVVVVRDLPYAGTDHPRQRLDLVLPAARAGEAPLPLVAFVHGGGWRSGDKRGGVARLRPFVSTGRYAGASIGYRLTGDAKWPAQLDDCKAAVRWLRAHAAEHGLDGERVAVYGSSAGGHLVAMLGVTGDVPDLAGEVGEHLDVGTRVACVVDFFGPTDLPGLLRLPGRGRGSAESRLFDGETAEERLAQAERASPVTWVSRGDAPVLIVHGSADPLVPLQQSETFGAALRGSDVEATTIVVDGGGHGVRGQVLDRRILQFLDRHLHGRGEVLADETIAAADLRPPRRRQGEGEPAPRPRRRQRDTDPAVLLAATDGAFYHVVWNTDGHQLLRTARADGEMEVLATTGSRRLPTRRVSYLNSRLLGVVRQGERLYVATWEARSFDRPLRGPFDSPDVQPLAAHGLFVHVVDLGEGRRVGRVRCALEVDQVDRKQLRAVTPERLAGPIEGRGDKVVVFGTELPRS